MRHDGLEVGERVLLSLRTQLSSMCHPDYVQLYCATGMLFEAVHIFDAIAVVARQKNYETGDLFALLMNMLLLLMVEN